MYHITMYIILYIFVNLKSVKQEDFMFSHVSGLTKTCYWNFHFSLLSNRNDVTSGVSFTLIAT